MSNDDWKPISTAPNEGSFLVYMPNNKIDQIQVANYHPFVKLIGNCFDFDVDPPTHWMPLPPPPTIKKTDPVAALAEIGKLIGPEGQAALKQSEHLKNLSF